MRLLCGGMILTAVALLKRTPQPTDEQIVEGLEGNLCRCCGYPKILAAVRRAAKNTPQPITAEVNSGA